MGFFCFINVAGFMGGFEGKMKMKMEMKMKMKMKYTCKYHGHLTGAVCRCLHGRGIASCKT